MILLISNIVLRDNTNYNGVLVVDIPELRPYEANSEGSYEARARYSGQLIASINKQLPNYDPFTVYNYNSCKMTEVNI